MGGAATRRRAGARGPGTRGGRLHATSARLRGARGLAGEGRSASDLPRRLSREGSGGSRSKASPPAKRNRFTEPRRAGGPERRRLRAPESTLPPPPAAPRHPRPLVPLPPATPTSAPHPPRCARGVRRQRRAGRGAGRGGGGGRRRRAGPQAPEPLAALLPTPLSGAPSCRSWTRRRPRPRWPPGPPRPRTRC